MDELKSKNLALSFALQGYAYSLPLELLFEKSKTKKNEMEMLIKYIDHENAIWTFGYPFMNQFLMVFNMEDDHVGIKKLKKTALPIVNINNIDYEEIKLKEEASSTFRTLGYITLFLVAIAIVFFIYHAIRKNNLNQKAGNAGINKDMVF